MISSFQAANIAIFPEIPHRQCQVQDYGTGQESWLSMENALWLFKIQVKPGKFRLKTFQMT